jgi:hypothetical protein
MEAREFGGKGMGIRRVCIKYMIGQTAGGFFSDSR